MDSPETLVRHYRWLRQYGLNDSHSGNASLRDGARFLVTPTGCCADTLRADALVASPVDGPLTPGGSLDAPLHQQLYRRLPEAGALLHSHGPCSIAITLDGRDFEPVDFEGAHYFARVPVLDIPYRDYVDQAPARVAEALLSSPVAIVRGHGVYAWGGRVELAYKWTSSLELSARIALLARQAGTLT